MKKLPTKIIFFGFCLPTPKYAFKQKSNLFLVFFIALSLTFSHKTFAQGEGNIWYFGSYAGLDFNGGSPVALTNGALSTAEGCASISNSAGSLLLYTDGITVWNRDHLAMPNGTGLLGDPSATQSGIIVPKPGSPNVYYVFTVAATGGPDGLRYSEVDMTLDGGLGDVTAIKNIGLATPVTEKITAVKQANGTDFWVIAHDFSTTAFLVYSVTSTGVNTIPVISNAGSIDNLYGIGYLKASTDGTMLVQAIDFVNIVDVLNFNNLSGVVTNGFSFSPPLNGGFGAYGVEFSPDRQRLYLGVEGSPNIYQYNLSLGTPSAIINSETIIGTISFELSIGALQIAPDGKIYIVKLNNQSLACISNPNALGNACGFVDNEIDLLVFNLGFGLPNFIQTIFQAPPIISNNRCFGDSTNFTLSSTASIDSVRWNFNDPASGILNSSALLFPYHIFSAPGTYNVSVIINSGTLVDTLTITTIILSLPNVSLGSDTSFCFGTTLTLNPGDGYSSYIWQDSSTNQTFTVSSSGNYFVYVQNNCGTSSDTIQISQLPNPILTVNLPTICVGQEATLTASGATTYSWINGPTQSSFVVSPTSTTSYFVIGTDSNGCIDTVVSIVTVYPLPAAPLAASNSPICAGDTINLLASDANNISYFWFGPNSFTSTTKNTTIFDATAAMSGVYSLFVKDNNTGCRSDTSTISFLVNSGPSITDLSATRQLCKKDTLQLSTSTIAASYLWNGPNSFSSTLQNPIILNANDSIVGIFTLIVSNSNSCTSQDTISVFIDCDNITEIVVPNVFTPNGDGENQLFKINNAADLKDIQVDIYDRWGLKVYSWNKLNDAWDGKTRSGLECPDGTYFYLINASTLRGKTLTQKGYLSLFR
jgi:gliding motility-associated-like protein